MAKMHFEFDVDIGTNTLEGLLQIEGDVTKYLEYLIRYKKWPQIKAVNNIKSWEITEDEEEKCAS